VIFQHKGKTLQRNTQRASPTPALTALSSTFSSSPSVSEQNLTETTTGPAVEYILRREAGGPGAVLTFRSAESSRKQQKAAESSRTFAGKAAQQSLCWFSVAPVLHKASLSGL